MKETELKPCPFCGGTDLELKDYTENVYGFWDYKIRCKNCRAYMDSPSTAEITHFDGYIRQKRNDETKAKAKRELIIAWNRRAENELREKQIEEMAKHCPCYFGEKCCIDAELPEKCDMLCQFGTYAEILYNAGYRKQSEGEWILTGTFKSTFPLPVANLYKACSVCRWSPPKYSDDYKEYNFCPNCGAKMKGGE